MTGPVVPAGGEELLAILLEALCLAHPPCQDHIDDVVELLPVVDRIARRRAAEELRAAADGWNDKRQSAAYADDEAADYLRDRADALTGHEETP